MLDGSSDRYRPIGLSSLETLARRYGISAESAKRMRAVATVLPFRTNEYVVENLIDWTEGESDPIFRLTFPVAEMLDPRDLSEIERALDRGDAKDVAATALRIRDGLNPQPQEQATANLPVVSGRTLAGIQHKYRETILVFPKAAQTCHAFCTYCYRWAQFVPTSTQRFGERRPEVVAEYVRDRPEVTNVIFTGGDPLMMSSRSLAAYVDPVAAIPHVQSIRVGTKAFAYWPYRLSRDSDAADLLDMIESVVSGGRQFAIMAHFTHHREIETDQAADALRRALDAGATIYTQAPIVRTINDSAAVWSHMWALQVAHGCIPYYMFVPRNTGPHEHFKVSLAVAVEVFRSACRRGSGLQATARGPVMSTTDGKLEVLGYDLQPGGSTHFTLRWLRNKDNRRVGELLTLEGPENASWLSDLAPIGRAGPHPAIRGGSCETPVLN